MRGKLFVLTSVVHGNGSKYLSVNLAVELQKKLKSTKKVLLIDFDLDHPCLAYEYVKNDDVHDLDNLIINGKSLNETLFTENIIHTSLGIDVIKGTKFPEKKKYFTREQIEKIIDLSLSLYDYVYVVIPSKTNNAATIYSLMAADAVVLVVINDYTNQLAISKTIQSLKKYYKEDKMINVVYNKHNPHANAEVSLNLNDTAKIIGVLALDDKGVDNLDLKKKTLKFSPKGINHKEFNKINETLRGE